MTTLVLKMQILVLAAFVVAVLAKNEVYQGWKSFYIAPGTKTQFEVLQAAGDQLELDFLIHPILGREGLVLVKPESQKPFLEIIEAQNIPYRVHSEDIKSSLDKEDQVLAARKLLKGSKSLSYNDYQEIEVIDEYLIDLAKRYKETVKLVEAGKTPEGRTIRYLKISTTNFQDPSKPVIVIDGGIHAREWISPPVVTWAIHKLVEDVTEPDLLERFDWVILPVANPDGYKYTFSTERFWRKTRSPIANSDCIGVDGNRNYDFVWNTVGTSNNPCADTYAGPKAFSEIETRVVRDILLEHVPRVALYLTVHSYGSMILYPWGHDGTLPPNAFALQSVGNAMASAIDAKKLPNFSKYVVGNSLLTLWSAIAGSSEDYAYSVGVPLSYTIELPGFGWTLDAFHLDPQYIQQVVEETWAGIVVGARQAGNLFRK